MKPYQLLSDPPLNAPGIIYRPADGVCIPFDLNNTDYQAYLDWLAAGNEPEKINQ
jgi:hypothetical protein